MNGTASPGPVLLDRIVQNFAGDSEVEHGTMFRRPGLRVGGMIFAFLGHDNRLIVKLPRPRAVELIATGAAYEVTMGTRTMREWIALPHNDEVDDDIYLWCNYAREAHDYVKSLPRSSENNHSV